MPKSEKSPGPLLIAFLLIWEWGRREKCKTEQLSCEKRGNEIQNATDNLMKNRNQRLRFVMGWPCLQIGLCLNTLLSLLLMLKIQTAALWNSCMVYLAKPTSVSTYLRIAFWESHFRHTPPVEQWQKSTLLIQQCRVEGHRSTYSSNQTKNIFEEQLVIKSSIPVHKELWGNDAMKISNFFFYN